MEATAPKRKRQSTIVKTYADIRAIERKHGLLPTDDLALFAWLAASGLGKGSLPSLRIYQAFRRNAKGLARGYRGAARSFRQEAKLSPDEACKRLGINFPGKQKNPKRTKQYYNERAVPWLRKFNEEPLADRVKEWKEKNGPAVAAFLKEHGIPASRTQLLSAARMIAVVSLPWEKTIVRLNLPSSGDDRRYSDSTASLNTVWHLNTAPLPLP